MEPIAIIGTGCRFPQADNPESFWKLLQTGKDAVAPIPEERWNIDDFYHPNPKTPGKMNARWGGFLQDVDKFDADFFGMNPEEVEHSDPQQRLFLEVAWEALENSAILPLSLAGSDTGVFIGLCTVDYHRLLYKNFECIGRYSGTGTTPSVTANRLSYLLDLRGPSIAVDSACSSSLVAIHLACQSLRSGECNLCLAGGVNLILSPDSTISSSQTQLLSAQGRCKSFDAAADGYVRGEGCGVVVLKRLSDAQRDGDNILGLIRGTAVNQDGLSNSLSAPNGLAQQAVIRQALENAEVQPSEIDYVNAHAVGTSIGDAIEFKALKAVLIEDRQLNQPCWIGSVKPNIGHLEAAAGVSALIGVILSLQNEQIPPHIHMEELNPYVSIEKTPFAIPTQLQQWCRGEKSRLAGVSAFGFGGTNAHIIVEEAPFLPISDAANDLDNSSNNLNNNLNCLLLSAKSDSALQEVAKRYQDYLVSHPESSLADICFTANTARTIFEHRLYVVTESKQQLEQQLNLIAQNNSGIIKGKVKGRKKPKVLFVFPSEDSQYLGMADQLYQTQPVFRAALDECEEIVEPFLDKSIRHLRKRFIAAANLTPLPPFPTREVGFKASLLRGERFGERSFLFPEMSISEILYSSTGEIENKKDCLHGALFAVEYALAKLWLSWGIKPKAVMGFGVGEYVAATIAGVLQLKDALKLVIDRSRLLQTFAIDKKTAETFAQTAGEVNYSQAKIPVICSLNGEKDVANAQYWQNKLQISTEYTAKQYDLDNYQVFLSLGSQTDLQVSSGIHLSSLSQGDDYREMLHSLGELIVRGAVVNWDGFYKNYLKYQNKNHQNLHHSQLPTYPFQRKRYWFQTKEKSQSATELREQTEAKLFTLLHQGEIHQLTELLQKTGEFSQEQVELLPEMLEALAKHHQQQVNSTVEKV